MNDRKYTRKVVVLCMLMFVIAVAMATRAAYVQLVRGEELAASVQNKSIRTYEELASRGEITDRNGKTLVSDVLCYTVALDYYKWQKQGQNDVLLRLCELLEEGGFETNDNLPMTAGAPYKYTYTDSENGVGRKLMKFLDACGWSRELPASRLFSLLCDRYAVSAELTSAQKRKIIGMRYFMEVSEFSAYNSPLVAASGVDIDIIAQVSTQTGLFTGVSVQIGSRREYATPYAAHILGRVAAISSDEYKTKKDLGYAMTDYVGTEGMEQYLEAYLRGIDGKRAVEVDRMTGKIVDEYMLEDADPGDTCRLTIDIDMQGIAEQSLAKTLADIGGDSEGGAVVVLSAKTGEVLAMASCPTYSLASYSADFAQNRANELKPLFNRAISGIYPPGSTFKMATAVAALESGIITPKTKIEDKGVYMFYAPLYTPGCWIWNEHRRTHGSINVSEAIKYSCNYFFYEVGRQMGIETLNRYASMLGLGQKTGIELENEKAGNLAGPESRAAKGGEPWQASETIQAAIGQTEQQFSPLQIARYVTTIVSGGKKFTPHLLREVWDYTETERLLEVLPEYEQVTISQSTVDAVKEGMRGVVTEDGTASEVFRNFPIEVGGKTGSAQTKEGRTAHGVFVSFAPYDDPEIVVCVVGEYAGSGGSVAPVCIDIYNYYFGLETSE